MTTLDHTAIISPEAFGEHWLAHRRLTRRMIEAFPEKELFHYSLGGMRPFSELAREMIGMCGAGIRGVALGDWEMPPEIDYHSERPGPSTREALLAQWDGVTRDIETLWPDVPASRFHEVDAAFGEYECEVWHHVAYFIDNEVHHRGQGYVYLRSLGIEPPSFWDR